VNCVVRRGNRLIGENTDGKGFLESLTEVLPPAGKEIVLFGAGGAARAVAVELALAGAKKITIVNRSRGRGEELVGVLRGQTSAAAEFVEWTGDYGVPATADVVINGTSIGLYDGEARVPVALQSLRPGLVAADVVFSPPDTAFLREAKARGCTCIDGLGMLVNQGVIGVRHWTGVDPDVPAMRKALAEALGVSIA
jgi:shikimate dehydrogenase